MRLVVFDMDGTLIDTHELITEHTTRTFETLGLPLPTAAEARSVIGLSLPVALGRLAGSEDAELIDRLVVQYKAHYRDSLALSTDREPLYPGALAALERLHAAPDTVLGIATGKGLNGVKRILDQHGLGRYFTTLQTPDHNPSKPHPGMLLRAMAETGVDSGETVMVGDTVFDIELAKAARTRSIGVTWGYHDPRDLVAAGAGAIIESYDELDAALSLVLE